jgi:hypothetical protein
MDHQKMQSVERRRIEYAKVPQLFSQRIPGTDPKAIRLFKFGQTGPKAFRMIPDAVETGEYCFFFISGGNFGAKFAAGAQVTLWDFGID